jgi:hypothetical protein
MKKNQFLIAALMSFCSLSSMASTGHQATVGTSSEMNSSGCWDGRHSQSYGGRECLEVVDARMSGEKLITKYKNTCGNRVYAQLCNQRKNGSYDCGSSGIGAYSTKTWSTYNAKGSYSWMAVGSDVSSQDWVCARIFGGSNWSNMGK